MTLIMFVGEATLLLVLQIQNWNDPVAAAIHEQFKAKPYLFAGPALMDALGTGMG